MVNIYEYKRKYDKVAYIDEPETKNKIYFRSPTVFEFLRYSEKDDEVDTKIECISDCVFAITQPDGTSEVDREKYLNRISMNAGLVDTLFGNIIRLSPLFDVEECKEIYKKKRSEVYRVLNMMKLQFLTTFGDYRLAEDCENFSFAKFMEYAVMLEEVTNKRGLFISELAGDDSLMDPETRAVVEKAKKQEKKMQRKPNTDFPANLDADTSSIKDPALRSAIDNAKLALRNKMMEDKVLSERGEIKKTLDWEAENKIIKQEGL